MNLLLLNYNNYFDRIVKKEDSKDDYITTVGSGNYAWRLNIDFDPKDGVYTEQLLNWTEEFTPNYLICCEGENYDIKSRWFILSLDRTRGKQYKAILKRDVLADNYSVVKEIPTYIEKGTILDPGNPLVYNNEGLAVNEIKTDEIELKDNSGIPWLVAYLQKETLGNSASHGSINYKISDKAIIEIPTEIDDWEYYPYATQDYKVADACRWDTYYKFTGSASTKSTHVCYVHSDNNYQVKSYKSDASGLSTSDGGSALGPKMRTAYKNYGYKTLLQESRTVYNFHDSNDYKVLSQYFGKTIKDSTGKYYKISYTLLSTADYGVGYVTNSDLKTAMNGLWNSATSQSQTANDKAFGITFKQCKILRLKITERTDIGAEWNATTTNILTNNNLYDIICMPYGDITCVAPYNGSQVEFNMNKDFSLSAMYDITRTLTSSKVLDLQLVPYCPCQEYIYLEGETMKFIVPSTKSGAIIPITKTTSGTTTIIGMACVAGQGDFTFDIAKEITLDRPTNKTGEVGAYVVWEDQHFSEAFYYKDMSFTLPDEYTSPNLPYEIQVSAPFQTATVTNITRDGSTYHFHVQFDELVHANDWISIIVWFVGTKWTTHYDNTLVEDIKISNECDKYRLCSPNYNGGFEFSLAKNGANIHRFNVDCTYKPYNPYIHLNPDFAGLYGRDFNDSRGLICGGDFSLGIMNDAFNAYEIQNKNYQNIFDRQMQNLSVEQDITKQEAKWQIASGAVTGAAAGALAGSAAGPWGAAAGAVVGAGASIAGGVADYKNLEKRQNEQRSFAVDNYNYSLQNVKALPNSITRTSALTFNNKIFPFIEYYTCTDTEKAAFKNKLIYDGMTINVIDTIDNWTEEGTRHFIKGQVIRFDNKVQDNNIASAIYEELNKGVYM